MLFRYAWKRVESRDVAEDLVQETFLSALRSAGDFQGRSTIQTWLIGILRHKLVDHLRRLSRDRERNRSAETQDSDPFHHGHWRVGLKRWPADPVKSVENQEFWVVLDECQQKLPAKLAVAFRLREREDLEMAEICEMLDITATNLSVRLHRARLLLRQCLDRNWFGTERTA